MKRAITMALAAALAAAILCTGCARQNEPLSRKETGSRGGPPSSLLLITLDTFRGDFFGAAGDPVSRTPHLDRISRTGIQFQRGLASCPLTLPSHATMLTGLEPPDHGVRDNGIFRLNEDVPTLAAALLQRGFKTAAFIGGFPLAARYGLARGFEIYDDPFGVDDQNPFVLASRSGAEVSASVGQWLGALAEGSSWFAWAHFFDAHEPYDAPAEWIRSSHDDAYRADIAQTDRFVGLLLRRASVLEPPPWIIILGDHGESRGDHGEATHGIFVYDSTLLVPALLWPAPQGVSPGLSRSVFRTIDVPSTAFALLGISEAPPGKGVNALSAEPRAAYFESRFAHLHFGWSPLRGIREGKWKLIDAPEPELFDLEADSGEKVNLALANEALTRELREKARSLDSAKIEAPRVNLDDESRAALESLGYTTRLQETSRESPDPASLPDPKKMMGPLAFLERAHGLLAAGRWQEALVPLRAALASDPRNKEVHQMLATAYSRLGRHRQAVDSYVQCLNLPPHENDRAFHFELATSYLQLGRTEEAILHLEKILAEDPKDPATWYNLGVARNRRGNPRGARRAWEMALKADSTYTMALQALGRVGRQ